MSYNTRRGRGGLNQNFVSGGQFQSNVKPGVQMGGQQQQRQQPQQYGQQQQANKPVYQTSVQQPLKSALKPAQQTQPQQQQGYQSQPQQQQQQQVQQQLKQEQKTPVKPQVAPAQPITPSPQVQTPQTPQYQMKEESMDTSMDASSLEGQGDDQTNGTGKKKFPWKSGAKTGASLSIQAGKISKKEKRGRRNQRLRKILQPKNALMVLNEIVGGQKYTVSEAPVTGDETFVATVTVEGQDFVGNGKSKNAAKTAAAEQALKNILLKKLRKTQNEKLLSESKEDTDVVMSESTDSTDTKNEEDDVSWLHVASYAIHKLFDSWDAEGILNETIGNSIEMKNALSGVTIKKPAAKKPAKILPSNAELMNPVMLLNQMRPGVVYEDFNKAGVSPNITFTIRAVIDEQEFYGTGTNKKLARRNCAYEVCKKLFNINYPPQDVQMA